jgi:hypothetical protein
MEELTAVVEVEAIEEDERDESDANADTNDKARAGKKKS